MTMNLPDRTPKRLNEWTEDDGPVLWWRFPITEPPYCGTPLDSGRPLEVHHRSGGEVKITQTFVGGWPGYHTHWTRFDLPIADWKR